MSQKRVQGIIGYDSAYVMEAFMYRCHPQIARVVELIRSGAILACALTGGAAGDEHFAFWIIVQPKIGHNPGRNSLPQFGEAMQR